MLEGGWQEGATPHPHPVPFREQSIVMARHDTGRLSAAGCVSVLAATAWVARAPRPGASRAPIGTGRCGQATADASHGPALSRHPTSARGSYSIWNTPTLPPVQRNGWCDGRSYGPSIQTISDRYAKEMPRMAGHLDAEFEASYSGLGRQAGRPMAKPCMYGIHRYYTISEKAVAAISPTLFQELDLDRAWTWCLARWGVAKRPQPLQWNLACFSQCIHPDAAGVAMLLRTGRGYLRVAAGTQYVSVHAAFIRSAAAEAAAVASAGNHIEVRQLRLAPLAGILWPLWPLGRAAPGSASGRGVSHRVRPSSAVACLSRQGVGETRVMGTDFDVAAPLPLSAPPPRRQMGVGRRRSVFIRPLELNSKTSARRPPNSLPNLDAFHHRFRPLRLQDGPSDSVLFRGSGHFWRDTIGRWGFKPRARARA